MLDVDDPGDVAVDEDPGTPGTESLVGEGSGVSACRVGLAELVQADKKNTQTSAATDLGLRLGSKTG
jgi:hypothetical protein